MNAVAVPSRNSAAPQKPGPPVQKLRSVQPSSSRRRLRKSSNKKRIVESRKHFGRRRFKRLLKRGELPPAAISVVSSSDDLSTITEESEIEPFDEESPFTTPASQKKSSFCCIQMLDTTGNNSKPSFRVFIGTNADFVELQGEEIVNFCSALLEYDNSWSFEVKLLSSGIVAHHKALDIIPSLRFLLHHTAITGDVATVSSKLAAHHHRKPWQKDWVFDDFEAEAAGSTKPSKNISSSQNDDWESIFDTK